MVYKVELTDKRGRKLKKWFQLKKWKGDLDKEKEV